MIEKTLALVKPLRQPEYVGENRCIPCTVVNIGLAAVASIAIGAVSILGAVAIFVACLLVIYFRGYLIPGTPTLTKRYFPDRVLAWFDKQPKHTSISDADEHLDINELLRSMDVITDCAQEDDLCLSPQFHEKWRQYIEEIDEVDTELEAIADALELHSEDLSFYNVGSAAVVRVNGKQVGQWESEAALHADIAAHQTLRAWSPRWEQIGVVNRSRVLNALRMFLTKCPECGGTTTLEQDTVESCCRSMDVAAVTCGICDARLFELQLTPDAPT